MVKYIKEVFLVILKGGIFMDVKYDKKILKYIETTLSFSDKILLNIFKRYTYKILKIGIHIGFDWEDKEYQCQPKDEKINDLSTLRK